MKQFYTTLFLTLLVMLMWGQDNNGREASGNRLHERFPVPAGYERIKSERHEFAWYLQHLPLKPAGSKVLYYDGRVKDRPDVYCGVVDIEIGNRDLLQCADACMLLYGEYQFRNQQFEDISYNFVSDGKPRYYKDYTSKRDYTSFRKYMNYVFAYANTRSLHKQLAPVKNIEDMQIGDIFIQTGNPYGHAVIVVDMAVNKTTGQKLYLLAQSYMPAQEIQILNNPRNRKLSPWYELNDKAIYTPEWNFIPGDLRRFTSLNQ